MRVEIRNKDKHTVDHLVEIELRIIFAADSEDAMEEDVQILEPNDINPCDWLLNRLPRLPIFANYYPQISNTLRFACQAENDPVVSIFKTFLTGTISPLRHFHC